MAQTTSKKYIYGLDGKLIPGICLTSISAKETGDEKEIECDGKVDERISSKIAIEVTGEANVLKGDFKCPVKGDFIFFKDDKFDDLYLRVMAKTDAATKAKATDKYEVRDWEFKRSNNEVATYSFTLRRDPDFQA